MPIGPVRTHAPGVSWVGRYFFQLQLWPLGILAPPWPKPKSVPHLKDLFHVCLGIKAQTFWMTFNMCNLGSKKPYLITTYVVSRCFLGRRVCISAKKVSWIPIIRQYKGIKILEHWWSLLGGNNWNCKHGLKISYYFNLLNNLNENTFHYYFSSTIVLHSLSIRITY